MKHIVRLPILAAFVSLFLFTGCSKEQSVTPGSRSLSFQVASNATQRFDYRGSTYCFTSQPGINLTGLPVTSPCVEMVRKNYVEVSNERIIAVWEGKVNLEAYPSITLPYVWNGKFIDRDPSTINKVFIVSFSIDKKGVASASLRWNGEVSE